MSDNLIRMIKNVRKKMESNIPLLNDEINSIIADRDRSAQRTERILDTLLDYLGMGIGESQFLRLNSYYRTFNRENADEYARFYNEIVDE